jgi:hypothetical protein
MGQRDEIKRHAMVIDQKLAANHFIEFGEGDELRDCQFSDWNHQPRPQDFELVIHPGGAIANFLGRRDPVAATGRFPWETSTDRSEVDGGSKGGLVHSSEFFEPAKKCFAGCMSERSFQDRLAYAWRLPDQHHFAQNRAAGNGRRNHPRTTPALPELCHMFTQATLRARMGGHFSSAPLALTVVPDGL